MPEPRTHYQLSFTARQAMVFFVLCLLALGLSYFFGLMTGLSSHSSKAAGGAAALTATAAPAELTPASSAAAAEPTPESAEAPPSLTRIAEQASGEPPNAPTAPAVLQTFEDRGAEEPTPTPAPAFAARSVPTPARAAPPPPGRGASTTGIWVQVASLTSRSEADSLVARLSRHGYKTQIAPGSSSKGRVYRVRVGPYRSEEDARRNSERLRRQERLPDAWIVREDR